MDHLLRRTANENTYYAPPPREWLLGTTNIRYYSEQLFSKVVGIRDEGKLVKMQTENGETFIMKTEGQDTTTGYPTLREAIQRTSPTLV